MKDNYIKYPSTLHLPYSEGINKDDGVVSDLDYEIFKGMNVVVTEKMDGENFSVYNNGYHSRSLFSEQDTRPKLKESRKWIKGYCSQFQYNIPEGWRFIFENVYAKHSIFYDNLETYAYLLSIWSEDNFCLGWGETKTLASQFGLTPPKVLYEGKYDETILKQIWNTNNNGSIEGFVVRNANTFHFDDFQKNVLKFVRKNHVQTTNHWVNEPLIKNLIK